MFNNLGIQMAKDKRYIYVNKGHGDTISRIITSKITWAEWASFPILVFQWEYFSEYFAKHSQE
jgi:hypothetical protein